MKRDGSFNCCLNIWRSGGQAHLGILDELAGRLDLTVRLDHDCSGIEELLRRWFWWGEGTSVPVLCRVIGDLEQCGLNKPDAGGQARPLSVGSVGRLPDNRAGLPPTNACGPPQYDQTDSSKSQIIIVLNRFCETQRQRKPTTSHT